MALVRYGGGVIEMSGSIAGNTFAKNRYGHYVRARTKPVNPNSVLQQSVRSAIGMLTDRWAHTVTALQRLAWNNYAAAVAMTNKLGETINLSGFNHYIRSNTIMAIQEGTLVDDGPIDFTLAEQDPMFRFTSSEGTQQHAVVFDNGLDWADENGAFMFIFEGKPQNAQRNFFAGPWRFLGFVAGVNGAPPASPANFGTNFGIAELQHQWLYARIMRADGRLSEKFIDDTFCAA